jgi:hypothetical protein
MFTLYSDDEIMEMYLASEKRESARQSARQSAMTMLEDNVPLDKIIKYVPAISMDELKQMQEELATTVHA